MSGHGGVPKITVLYQISNAKGGSSDQSYNAFELHARGGPVSLSDVKNGCTALNRLNAAGSNGYHWRVRVDDKATKAGAGAGAGAGAKYSWWDIQDQSARLPVRQVSFAELTSLLSPPKKPFVRDDIASNSVSSVTRSLGKAVNRVAASVDGGSTKAHDNFPRVPVVIFKLVDITKIYDDHSRATSASGGRGYTTAHPSLAKTPSNARRPVSQPVRRNPNANANANRQPASPGRQPTVARVPSTRRNPQPPQHKAPQPAPVQEGTLMDFGPTTTASKPHVHSTPSSFGAAPTVAPAQPRPQETRAQKLQREYKAKAQTENRVWDDVDQRYVAVDPKQSAAANKSTASAPPGANVESSKPKLKGISLENVNTAGKSANVQKAVEDRVNEMKSQQQKALEEVRQREATKKSAEADEDVVRQKLEPKIKAWSEEHGKKKQLRALLASLHTVLWPGAKWKQIGLGDLLDDKKVRLAFHKASRVVHPDKTMRLPAEQRFLAKRIFDALSQANTK